MFVGSMGVVLAVDIKAVESKNTSLPVPNKPYGFCGR